MGGVLPIRSGLFVAPRKEHTDLSGVLLAALVEVAAWARIACAEAARLAPMAQCAGVTLDERFAACERYAEAAYEATYARLVGSARS